MGTLFSSDAANIVQAFPEAIAGDVDENAARGDLLLRLISACSRMPDCMEAKGHPGRAVVATSAPPVHESWHKPGMWVMYEEFAASHRMRTVRKGS